MNRDHDQLRELLDDVLPASAENCGPSRADVLHLLRTTHQRRRRVQTGAALLAIIALAVVAQLWKSEPRVVAPIVETPAKPEPGGIHHVNDEELFALLKDTPTAVMEMPNGQRALLVIQR